MDMAGHRPKWKIGVALTGSVLLLSACWFVFPVVRLSSRSMSPTLLPGDSVLVNRLVYHLRLPQRGDLIVFSFPQARDREFVKRVVGLPGDVVAEESGRFRVNGVALRHDRPEASDNADTSSVAPSAQRVPPEHLYVLGDNKGASLDSRYWGAVDQRDVVGKAVLICWSRGMHWWDVRWDRIGRRLE